MKSPYFLALLLAFVCSLSVTPAGAVAGDNDWRLVTPEEIALKTAKVEADADAEAIFWEVRIDDSSEDNLSMQHYVRVKIFTERGREKYSKFDIPFSKRMKIKDLAARVIKSDGSIVEVGKQDIIEREIVKAGGVKIKAKSIAMPALEVGAIVEYRYREIIDDGGAAGMHLKFQRDIPLQTLSYYYKPYNKNKPNYQSFNFHDTAFVKDEKGFWVATRTNVPAFKEEPHMPPEDQVIPWMLLQTVRLNIASAGAFSITFTFKDPSNPITYWGAVGRERTEWAKFLTRPDKEIKKVATELTASETTVDAKLARLYEFCQTQIRNTSYEPGLTDEERKKLPSNKSAADVLKNKTASSQFVDLLFGAMANSLGLETRVAFLADRSEIFFNPDMTNEGFLHPGAIAVKVGNAWKFYDPGVKFLPAGMLVWYEEGVWAFLVGEKEFAWVKTPLSSHEKSVTKRTGRFNLTDDGTVEGDVKIEYHGQRGVMFKLDSYDESEPKREEDLKDEIKAKMSTAEITNVRFENINDPAKPVICSYHIRVPGYALRTGKRLLLQPSFFEHGQSAMFSTAARKYQVYFRYPWSEFDDIEFVLPEGYALDNADRPAPFSAAGVSDYTVRLGLTLDNKTLVLKRQFYFGGGANILFPATSYSSVKDLFDRLQKSDEHTIALKSAAN